MKLSVCFGFLICCCLFRPGIPLSCSASCQLAPDSAPRTGAQESDHGANPQLAPGPASLSGIPQSASDETWRSHPPPPKPSGPLRLPPARETRLPNGLTLVLVADHRAPIVTVDVAVPVGEVNDPPGQTGLAEATADLLTEGAGHLSSHDLAREVERLGGRVSSSSSPDYSEVSASVLAENAGPMIEIVADILLRPLFPQQEVALYKNTRIEKLALERQDPAFVVSEEFNRIIYGAHPYSASAPTPESISAMSRSSIQDFYQANYGPEGSYLVAVGDFDPILIEARLRSILGAWRQPPPRSPGAFPPPPARTEKTIYLVDRPGSEQADIRIGNLAIKRSAPDFIPLMIANTILGGGTSSRLFLNIREQKGYTYDVSSSLAGLKQYGTFFGATETRNEAVALAIKEILVEFDRIRSDNLSVQELQSAKNFINGEYSLLLSTQEGLANQVLRTRLLGLEQGSLEAMPSRVEAVTADQVRQAARSYILADRPAIVVVGDAATLKKALESLAPVVVSSGPAKPKK
jgi:zinc protease